MTPTRTMLVAVSGRAGAAVPARLEGLVTGGVRVVRRGRRAGAQEHLVEEILASGAKTLVVETVSVLSRSPARALGIVVALRSAGVAVVSLNDGALVAGDAATLAAVAAFLCGVEQRLASKRGRSAVAVARVRHARIGRPRKEWDRVRAAALVAELGSYRKAATALGIGCTTLRRGLKAA